MNEWGKTLISTTAGFVAGLLAEPIKIWIDNRKKQADLRKAIYDELVTVTGRMAAFLQYAEVYSESKDLQWALKTFDLNPISYDIFEHYYDKDRALVFSLPEARWVAHLYRLLKRLNENCGEDPTARLYEIEKGLTHIYTIALDGAIPAPTLKNLAEKWFDGRREKR
jgi:hypothetical protein